MDLFFPYALVFFIAGYLFHVSEGDEWKFIVKKTKRLITPLILLTCIVFFPKVLLSNYALRSQEGGAVNLLLALLIPNRNPIQLLWFLNVLYGVYLIAVIVQKIISPGIIGWLILGVITSYLSPDVLGIDFLGISEIVYFLPYFCCGIICGKIQLCDENKFSYPYGYLSFCL